MHVYLLFFLKAKNVSSPGNPHINDVIIYLSEVERNTNMRI